MHGLVYSVYSFVCAQVEEINQPAKRLYESVGYSMVHRDETAAALRLQPGVGGGEQLLRTDETTLLLMGKGLA